MNCGAGLHPARRFSTGAGRSVYKRFGRITNPPDPEGTPANLPHNSCRIPSSGKSMRCCALSVPCPHSCGHVFRAAKHACATHFNRQSLGRPRQGPVRATPLMPERTSMPPSTSLAVRNAARRPARIRWSYTEFVAALDPLENCLGFDWDDANTHKNWERHRVAPEQAEDVFFHAPLVVRRDFRHSKREKRYYALGQTGAGRRLFVAFTVRRKLIRVISARDMNRNETETYERYEEETS